MLEEVCRFVANYFINFTQLVKITEYSKRKDINPND